MDVGSLPHHVERTAKINGMGGSLTLPGPFLEAQTAVSSDICSRILPPVLGSECGIEFLFGKVASKLSPI